jgi:prepilin-type N-terminal cleavage/methylation domain-containing protein
MKHRSGYTLIELSIVLVIIGLIVGGVLVGQDLIKAAEVRAQISQIEHYQTAANTFRLKYGALPGDIAEPNASAFGFKPRGIVPGSGDGNEIIEGRYGPGADTYNGISACGGETVMFWADLATANLIEGRFDSADPNWQFSAFPVPVSNVPLYLPTAKIGNGNYVYVWSGGVEATQSITDNNGINYYGLSAVTELQAQNPTPSNMALSAVQAFAIDSKMDDGVPQSGNVMAMYVNYGARWAGNTYGVFGALPSSDAAPSDTTCYDGIAGQHQYSKGWNKGANINCALSFRFQ